MHKTVHNQEPQLKRIRIWTESWNLKDYDTCRAFLYQLMERKPVHGKKSIGYWIMQSVGYKNIGLHKKKNAF